MSKINHNVPIESINGVYASSITYANLKELLISRGCTDIGYKPMSESQLRSVILKNKVIVFEATDRHGVRISIAHIFPVIKAYTDKAGMSKVVDSMCDQDNVIVIMPGNKKPMYSGTKNVTRIHEHFLDNNVTERWNSENTIHKIMTDEEAHRETEILFRGSKFDLAVLDVEGVESVWLGLEVGDVLSTITVVRGITHHMRIVEKIKLT